MMTPAPVDDKASSSDGRATTVTVSASYQDTSAPAITTRHFSLPMLLPLPAADSGYVKNKTAYLSELRTSTKQLQEEINAFLTQKMEEDKLRVVTNESCGTDKMPEGGSMDEADEETYGEEGVEDGEEG